MPVDPQMRDAIVRALMARRAGAFNPAAAPIQQAQQPVGGQSGPAMMAQQGADPLIYPDAGSAGGGYGLGGAPGSGPFGGGGGATPGGSEATPGGGGAVGSGPGGGPGVSGGSPPTDTSPTGTPGVVSYTDNPVTDSINAGNPYGTPNYGGFGPNDTSPSVNIDSFFGGSGVPGYGTSTPPGPQGMIDDPYSAMAMDLNDAAVPGSSNPGGPPGWGAGVGLTGVQEDISPSSFAGGLTSAAFGPAAVGPTYSGNEVSPIDAAVGNPGGVIGGPAAAVPYGDNPGPVPGGGVVGGNVPGGSVVGGNPYGGAPYGGYGAPGISGFGAPTEEGFAAPTEEGFGAGFGFGGYGAQGFGFGDPDADTSGSGFGSGFGTTDDSQGFGDFGDFGDDDDGDDDGGDDGDDS